MSIKVKIDVKDVMKKAPKYADTVHEKVKKAVIQTAQVNIETEAKKNLRNAGHVDTGRLMTSIHTEYEGKTDFSYSIKGKSKKYKRKVKQTSFDGSLSEKAEHELEAVVGSNVIYAHYIHRITPYLLLAYEVGKEKLKDRLKKIFK